MQVVNGLLKRAVRKPSDQVHSACLLQRLKGGMLACALSKARWSTVLGTPRF